MELLKDLLGQNINQYVWIAILASALMLSNVEIDKRNLKTKVSILYIVFFLLFITKQYNIMLLLGIFLLILFIFLEFIYLDEFARKILKKPFFFILDFLYKIIFEYKILYFIFSTVICSEQVRQFIKNFVYSDIFKNYQSFIFKYELGDKYNFIVLITSVIVLSIGVIKCFNNEFDTCNFTEIKNKMDKIKLFSNFSKNTKLYDFSNMLIHREDRSYFFRNNSYSWLSLEFIKYRIYRMYKYCLDNYFISFKILKYPVNILILIFYMIIKFLKLFIKLMQFFIKIFFKVIIQGNKIKKYMRGYSTIEMQLIRTLAVNDGYSSHIFQRKAYEFIYSTIYFKSLLKYFEYHQYRNTDEFKYYLIYLYIRVAPAKINNNLYKNILSLYKKKKINDITMEEFYVWTFAISFRKIDNNLVIQEYIDMFGLDKRKLKSVILKLTNKK